MSGESSTGHVALLGLGAMGSALAGTLLRDGIALTVWNRSPEACAEHVSAGAREAESPAAAVADADVVITMLAHDEALDSVMGGRNGALDAMNDGALHISMSTISAASAECWEVRHRDAGQQFIAAPVFGRPPAAASGSLFIVAAGPSAALARAESLFCVLGQRCFIVGDRPAQACAMKLAGNFMIMAATEAMGEAMAVAESAGIDAGTVQEVLTGSIFDTPIYRAYGDMIVKQQFSPAGFTAQLGLKDMRLFNVLAEAGGVPAPFLDIVQSRLCTVVERHGDEADWAAVGNIAREDRGKLP